MSTSFSPGTLRVRKISSASHDRLTALGMRVVIADTYDDSKINPAPMEAVMNDQAKTPSRSDIETAAMTLALARANGQVDTCHAPDSLYANTLRSFGIEPKSIPTFKAGPYYGLAEFQSAVKIAAAAPGLDPNGSAWFFDGLIAKFKTPEQMRLARNTLARDLLASGFTKEMTIAAVARSYSLSA